MSMFCPFSFPAVTYGMMISFRFGLNVEIRRPLAESDPNSSSANPPLRHVNFWRAPACRHDNDAGFRRLNRQCSNLTKPESDLRLCSGGNERFNCHFRRIHFVSFGNGCISQTVILTVCEAVTALDVWVASNFERFDDALPHQISVKYFYHYC